MTQHPTAHAYALPPKAGVPLVYLCILVISSVSHLDFENLLLHHSEVTGIVLSKLIVFTGWFVKGPYKNWHKNG
jgi:hypothetical protein